jgi:hypothetical protein
MKTKKWTKKYHDPDPMKKVFWGQGSGHFKQR